MTKKQHFKRRTSWLSNSLWTFTIACFVTVSTAFAQEANTIQGTVTSSSDGMPLPGANILEKGTTNGVQTDFDGNYSITVSSNDAILVISYIGYLRQEINVENQSSISVELTEDSAKLDEVVVIGYGSQKKSDISGSVSQVSTEEIARNPSPNLSNSLVGQATGIIATQRSGEPGSDDSDILIRGIGTTGDSSPIYVIDGIVRSARDFSQLTSNEIESFSILKDAASAAVFGIRAGNGVILVTTKRGTAGKMNINFSTSLGVQERTREPEILNSYDFALLYNEALSNEGKDALYSEDDLMKYKNRSNLDTHPDSDWLSVLNKTALVRTYNIAASGGSEKVRYATSIGYLNQDGIIPSDNFKRYNFRSNIDAEVTNTTTLSFDISGRDEKSNAVASPDYFRWVSAIPPNRSPIKWSNGGYSSGPAYLAEPENGYRKRGIQSFKGRVELNQQLPVKGLSVKAIASYDKTLTDNKNWIFPNVPFFDRLPDGSFVEGTPLASSLDQDHNDYQSVTMEAHLNYTTSIGKSNLTGLLLYTETKESWNFLGAFRDGYTLGIDELNFGAAANRNNEGYSGTSGRQGVVGRLNWTFNDKYILEGSFRADGSEQFADGKRWGFFPSGSLAYVISKESFFKNSTTVDLLKFRASYGVLGNDRLRDANGNLQRFLYLQSYNIDGNVVFGNADVQQAIVEGNLSNPNVTWETVKKLNIGLDWIFWKGILSGNIDYFSDKRSDILGSRDLSVPSLLGVGLPVENLAKVNNSGFEVALGHRNRVGDDFKYSVNTNLTYAKNKIIFIDEPVSENPNIRRTGLPLGTQFGFHSLGLFQTQEEVDNAAVQIGNTGPGDIRFEDVNGDGQIDDNDRVPIGRANIPEIIFGFNTNLEYKNFEFSFLFQGATNVNQYYSQEGAWPFYVGGPALESNLDRWTPTNTDASEPRVLIDVNNLNQSVSSFWMKDASYIRLKNVELAYNVPVENFNTKILSGMRIYLNANNIYTWSKIENFDPENASGRGWDYPQLRIWNFGVNFNF